jgi:carotenoid cleavage dioxygenase-like enzyme
MVASAPAYAAGFYSSAQEHPKMPLTVRGVLPDWLRGMLVRTGPGKFEVNGESYHHWFDGLAMLVSFDFSEVGITYSNRFLRSGSYCDAQKNQAIYRPEFATNPDWPLWKRLLLNQFGTDNGNVSITVMDGQVVAVTETPRPTKILPENLETLERLKFDDDLSGFVTTAHPHIDFERQELISYLIDFGRTSTYQFYTQPLTGSRRKRVASVETNQPAYLHSFGLTPNYIVLVEFPLRVNPLKLATTRFHDTPFIQNYQWQPDLGTQFHIIDRHSGEVIKTCQTEPCFAFHHVNVFEEDDQVVVDMSVYPDASLIDRFYLDALRQGIQSLPSGSLRRYRIPLTDGEAEETTLAEVATEFPRINYRRCNGNPYEFVYGGENGSDAGFIDRLVKVNVQTGAVLTWQETYTYPTEPVFVAAPNAAAEDEGVLLSVVLDGRNQNSFLLILDAKTLKEFARADLPQAIPFGLHGQYFENPETPAGNFHLHR